MMKIMIVMVCLLSYVVKIVSTVTQEIGSNFIRSVDGNFVAPDPVWPAEWSCFTNITRSNFAYDDVGTQFYSAANKRQRVSHANMYNAGAVVALWAGRNFYQITNNYQECCINTDFKMPMPSVNWVDNLKYTGNETIAGVNCYRYENAELMQTVYWISQEDLTPVAWYNDPDDGTDFGPYVQYFTGVSIQKEEDGPLSKDIFAVPKACVSAAACAN